MHARRHHIRAFSPAASSNLRSRHCRRRIAFFAARASLARGRRGRAAVRRASRAGHPPFYDENEATQVSLITSGIFEFESPAWDGVSADAKDLIASLLAVAPAERCTAAGALAHRWLARAPGAAERPSEPLRDLPRIMSQHRLFRCVTARRDLLRRRSSANLLIHQNMPPGSSSSAAARGAAGATRRKPPAAGGGGGGGDDGDFSADFAFVDVPDDDDDDDDDD